MKDLHIRAILLMVIAILCIAGAVASKLAGIDGLGIGLLFFIGLAAFVLAGLVLLDGDPSEEADHG